ncbi:MAG: TrkA family potassium uptake protein [Dehalococcoidia bacterium]|nr:TrkA family potassium uptake protein [Dehalococcoidia bacterium]
MYVIIVGAGEVGRYLGKELLNSGNEVLMIERDHSICEELGEELGSVFLCGDGCEVALLTKAGVARADMFIAVTDQDDDNLAACQIAKQKFHVPEVIAKVNSPKNEHIFAKLGIDHTVDRVSLVLEHIKLQIPMFPLIHLLSLKDRGLELVLVRILERSPAAGKAVKDLSLPDGSVVSLMLRRGQECVVPATDAMLEVGDQLVCSIPSGSEEIVRTGLSVPA